MSIDELIEERKKYCFYESQVGFMEDCMQEAYELGQKNGRIEIFEGHSKNFECVLKRKI